MESFSTGWDRAGQGRAGQGRAGQGREGQVMCSRKDLRISSLWNIHLLLLRFAQSWATSGPALRRR